jgi:hypothetical protein
MTTFEQGFQATNSPESARPVPKPKKYDIRVIDHFYVYCESVAYMHRHRDEARVQSQFATRRAIATLVLAGGLLCYYLLERIPQVLSVL